MKSELKHIRNPYRIYVFWFFFYVAIISLSAFGLIKAADRIKTHTLPVGSIELSVPYSKYLVGEPITFSITNNYNGNVYVVNNCPSEPLEVYRLENGKWVRQHDQVEISKCDKNSRLVNVPAKGIVHGSFAAWKNLFSEPGKYRIVAYVEYYNELPYQDIEVILPPTINKTTPTESDNQASSQQETRPQNDNTYTDKQSKTVTTPMGSISVQYDSTNIYVISIAPASGCTYEGGQSGSQLEVTFKCTNGETQVQLRVVNGQLVSTVANGDD